MDKITLVLMVITVALVLMAGTQAVQLAGLKEKITLGGTTSTGTIDTTGWTENEKMNYEMHGVIPARAGGGTGSSSSGMVGGC